MPAAVIDVLSGSSADGTPFKTWTRSDCEFAERAGILDGGSYELVEGQLIDKMGKKQRHVLGVSRVSRRLVRLFGDEFVCTEAPIDVGPEDKRWNEPQPDVIVLRTSIDGFESEHPQPSDLVLVVEVSDSSIAIDLGAKADLYARAGTNDYWVFDMQRRRMIVHREPNSSGYCSVSAYGEHDIVSPLAAPDAHIRVGDLLP